MRRRAGVLAEGELGGGGGVKENVGGKWLGGRLGKDRRDPRNGAGGGKEREEAV